MRRWLICIQALTCRGYKVQNAYRRQYATTSTADSVTIPCHSNGSITLDIHRPTSGSIEPNSSLNVLIYLPSGPFGKNSEQDASSISTLHSSIQCPIVQINYRLSEHYKFPTPIHDILCGFDWIVDNLLLKRGITRVGRSEFVGQLAVCGEHIGGGLATALALTECRIGQPGIVAAAVNNPIVDWVSIDVSLESEKGRRAKTPNLKDSSILMELQRIRYLRQRFFQKPENYFDPFASPILFFRSAGVAVPLPPQDVPIDDMEQLSLHEREQIHAQEIGMSADQDRTKEQLQTAVRKASRRFPSEALGLRLPQFRISTGSTSPLQTQASELARALRQSVVRQSKDASSRSSDFGRKVLMDDEIDDMDEEQKAVERKREADAKEKVELHVKDGSGAWDGSIASNDGLKRTAEWLEGKLEMNCSG